MRPLDPLLRLARIGAGTPKEAAARRRPFLLVAFGGHTLAIVFFALDKAGLGILVVTVTAEPT